LRTGSRRAGRLLRLVHRLALQFLQPQLRVQQLRLDL